MKPYMMILFPLLLLMTAGCNSKYTDLLNQELTVRSNAIEYAKGCFQVAGNLIPDFQKNPMGMLQVAGFCSQSGAEVAAHKKMTPNEFFMSGCFYSSLAVVGTPKDNDAKQALLKSCEALLVARKIERQAM